MTASKVRVWDVPTRLFHWALALSFLGAFVTSDTERLRDVHTWFGYAMLGLVAFRLLWGLVGTRYARFRSFAHGPRSVARLVPLLERAGTILWNGPVGVFELPAFAGGTRAIAEAIAGSPAFSIAGGGDTLSAIATFGVTGRIGYVSTGGGAFLEFLEGRTLPAVAVLEERGREVRERGAA